MANPAGDYHRGEMDVHEQAGTYHAFLSVSKWFSLHLAAVIVFLVIWFCTGAGFWAGLITGLVIMAVGIVAFRAASGGGGH